LSHIVVGLTPFNDNYILSHYAQDIYYPTTFYYLLLLDHLFYPSAGYESLFFCTEILKLVAGNDQVLFWCRVGHSVQSSERKHERPACFGFNL